MIRGAGLDVGFVILASPADGSASLGIQHAVRFVGKPVDEDTLADELERVVAGHSLELEKCVFVACASCGHPHIAMAWPPALSFCSRCVECSDDANETYVERS